MPNSWFRFKEFTVYHDKCAHKVGTDGVLLAAWVQLEDQPKYILDIGSGSGLISLMMAQRFPSAHITGIELDPSSYRQSLENIRSGPYKDRIHIRPGDFLSTDFKQNFDLIISNPPFFKNSQLSGKSQRDQARHEFSLPHDKMMERCCSLLSENGNIALILPVEESLAIYGESSAGKLHLIRKTTVANKPSFPARRILTQFSEKPAPLSPDTMTIRSENGDFSDHYRQLTKDFYLDF